ncbi:ATP-binding protein [Oryzibacter oryziterrae]|uniref:ATP-binding protein n=1 Tax=Oryzibacter oryziterrae TaxID=2766474 RepID=UPI001F1C4600|nr:ATP-binding protein [Oryzibacter oryziterrae]
MKMRLSALWTWLTGSLALRLVMASAIWSALALAAAGWLLTELHTDSLIRSFDERIIVYEKTLAGIVAAGEDGAADPGTMGDPRFGRVQSGWYWMIVDGKTRETVGASQSLLGETLKLTPPTNNGAVQTGFVTDPSGKRLRQVTQRVFLSGGRIYDLYVTGNIDDLGAEISIFRYQVLGTLSLFALGLLVATYVQVKFGLRPLATLGKGLADIRQGRAQRLEGKLPREIAPLGKELNALIDTNSAIVERSRTQVGNLAHALKTPLAVVLNEARADGGPLAGKVIEQAEVMRSEIDRYLDRARLAADRKVMGTTAEVARSLESLAKVLRRAYPNRAISVTAAEGVKARIERRDLEEVVGNLMDNACKYGREQVSVHLEAGPSDRDRPMVRIVVEDDGPGLEPEQYAAVLGRGKRLDESLPGSGMGLAIVAEIVETYGGSIDLGASVSGGLSVAVRLPRS